MVEDFFRQLSFPKFWFFLAVMNLTRYYLIAGLIYFSVWKGYFNPFHWRAHNPAGFDSKNIPKEILLSFVTLTTSPLAAAFVLKFKPQFFQVYYDISEYGIAWYLGSFGLCLVLHDTWFYWVHRLLHTPRLFKLMHKRHHDFHYPSPFAGLALDYGEAVVHSFFLAVLTFFIPLHIHVIMAIFVFLSVTSIYGHMGFDIFKPRKSQWGISKVLCLSPNVHGNHHLQYKGNFALYFKTWDYLMGTSIGGIQQGTRSKNV